MRVLIAMQPSSDSPWAEVVSRGLYRRRLLRWLLHRWHRQVVPVEWVEIDDVERLKSQAELMWKVAEKQVIAS